MPDDKNFNTHFDEWYFDRKKRGGFSSFYRKKTWSATHSSIGHWLSEAASVVGDVINTFQTRTSITGYDRQRIEAHKKLVRRIERTEKKLESRQKAVVVCGILTLISIPVIWELPATMFLAGLTGYMVYSSFQTRKKLDRLHEEYHRLEQGDFPLAVPHAVERIVMHHAYTHGGKVYPELLALEADLSLSQAEQVLGACVRKRLASIELDADGRTYYYFARLDTTDPYSAL